MIYDIWRMAYWVSWNWFDFDSLGGGIQRDASLLGILLFFLPAAGKGGGVRVRIQEIRMEWSGMEWNVLGGLY